MIKRSGALAALVLLIAAGASSGQAATPRATTTPHGPIGGTLVSESIGANATTLVVNTPHRGQVTVTVSGGTIYVRRFNGASALDELNLGDNVAVFGTFATGSTTAFNATRVKDFSIQEAATRAVLQIKTVNTAANSFTGVVLHDSLRRVRPFDEGATVTVTVSMSSTPMTKILTPANGTLVAGSMSNLAVGQRVTVLGVFDRLLRSYTTTRLVRIH